MGGPRPPSPFRELEAPDTQPNARAGTQAVCHPGGPGPHLPIYLPTFFPTPPPVRRRARACVGPTDTTSSASVSSLSSSSLHPWSRKRRRRTSNVEETEGNFTTDTNVLHLAASGEKLRKQDVRDTDTSSVFVNVDGTAVTWERVLGVAEEFGFYFLEHSLFLLPSILLRKCFTMDNSTGVNYL